MVDSATRFMAVRTIPDESSNSLMKAVERKWIRYFGPLKQLSVDEWSGWGSDAMMQWSRHRDEDLSWAKPFTNINCGAKTSTPSQSTLHLYD